MRIVHSADQQIVGSRQENTPYLNIVQNPSGSSHTEELTLRDQNILRTTTTPALTNYRIEVVDPRGPATPTYASITPSVCTVDAAGNVTVLSPGTAVIEVVVPGFRFRDRRGVSSASLVVTDAFVSWRSGSLAAHITSAVEAMIASKSPGAGTQALFSALSGNHSAPNATRNGSIFTGALDLSAISVYRSSQAQPDIFPVVLVTPRHVITGHAGPSVGEKIVWKRPDGSYETRTIAAHQRISAPTGTDHVAILDAAVTGIAPMKMLPGTWQQKLPSINLGPGVLPILNKGFTAGDWIRILGNGTSSQSSVWLYLARIIGASPFAPWSSAIIGGDSNGPVVVPIDGTPVLMHCMNTTAGGLFYAAVIDGIQSQLDAMSSAQGSEQQSLTFPDLSSFNTYT